MKYLTAAQLQEIGTRILDAAGSPHAESETVCEVLVRANLFGHDSHGVMRIPQYVGEIRSGAIRPGTPVEIERETPASAVIQAHQGWGMVIARQAMRLAIDKARQVAIGTVVVRGSQHVGRVGEYPTMAAAEKYDRHGGRQLLWHHRLSGPVGRRRTAALPQPHCFRHAERRAVARHG